MATTLHDLLQPQVILDVVSRIRKGRGRLGQFFGMHPSAYDAAEGVMRGPNTKPVPTRTGAYRIFDRTRTAAEARAPGAGPAMIQQNPIGEVSYSCIRWHEKQRLNYEDLGQLSKVVGPNSVIDPGGQDYIAKQIEYQTERINNAVELSIWGMTRGKLYIKNSGERWIPQLTVPATVPYVTVDYKVPAGNLLKLNMLGAGDIIGTSWDNTAAPILDDLAQIDDAFVYLTGDSLKHVWLDTATWMNVIKNTQVINAAGSANTPFQSFDRVKERGFDGEEIAEYTAILRGLPTVIWHIINERLVIDGGSDPSYAAGSGTLGKAIPTGSALFCPEPDNSWVDFLYCGEHVSEMPGQPATMRMGWHFWKEYITQPTVVELIGLFNGIPRLSRPNNLAFGTVVY